MQWKTGISIVAAMLLAGGCGGSGVGEGPQAVSTPQPQPPPPGDGGGDPVGPPPVLGAACEVEANRDGARGGIWIGSSLETDPGETRLLVAETGEFHWITPSGWDQKIFGTFQSSDGSLATSDAIWVWVSGLTWLETEFVGVNMTGELDDDSNLKLSYETASSPASHGTLSFAACNAVYARGASPASIAGTYVDGDMMLAVDTQGGIYLQDRTCVGSGTVEPIDPSYNMYRMELVMSSCAGNEVYAIGTTFSGLAYLGDSGPGFTGDLLEYSLSSTGDQRTLIWTRRVRR